MAHMAASGEVVVDLFTGIGYYTLPLVAKAGAAKAVACEWNSASVEALQRNVELNGLHGRVQVLPGDCREVAPQGVADRVCLGLLPSSRTGWATALRALKPAGGWLHVHENVLDKQAAAITDGIVQELQALADAMHRGWALRCTHIERVKWYAPHVRHVVLDVWCAAPDVPVPEVQVISKATNAPVCVQNHGQNRGQGQRSKPEAKVPPAAVEVPNTPPAASWSVRWRAFRFVPTVTLSPGCTAETFAARVTAHRTPAVVRGLNLGPCVARWDPVYLADEAANPDASTRVGVHVCNDPSGRMAFVPSRNFTFETMTLAELVVRAAGPQLGDGTHSTHSTRYEMGVHPRLHTGCGLVQVVLLVAKKKNKKRK